MRSEKMPAYTIVVPGGNRNFSVKPSILVEKIHLSSLGFSYGKDITGIILRRDPPPIFVPIGLRLIDSAAKEVEIASVDCRDGLYHGTLITRPAPSEETSALVYFQIESPPGYGSSAFLTWKSHSSLDERELDSSDDNVAGLACVDRKHEIGTIYHIVVIARPGDTFYVMQKREGLTGYYRKKAPSFSYSPTEENPWTILPAS